MTAQYKQVDFVTESKPTKQRGGKRPHAGAKLKHGEPTAVIRLPVSVIERIKNGEVESVTNSNELETLRSDVEYWKERGLEDYRRADTAERQVRELQAQLKEALARHITPENKLCQRLTGKDLLCKNKSGYLVDIDSFSIYLCEKHYKEFCKLKQKSAKLNTTL